MRTFKLLILKSSKDDEEEEIGRRMRAEQQRLTTTRGRKRGKGRKQGRYTQSTSLHLSNRRIRQAGSWCNCILRPLARLLPRKDEARGHPGGVVVSTCRTSSSAAKRLWNHIEKKSIACALSGQFAHVSSGDPVQAVPSRLGAAVGHF